MNRFLVTSSILACLFIQYECKAKPVQTTTLDEAKAKAPIIIVATSGTKEYDDLPEGKIVELEQIPFDCRKQKFSVTSIIRNNTKQNLAAGQTIELHNKSNGCISYPIRVQRRANKLEVSTIGTNPVSSYNVDILNKPERVILFLQTSYDEKNLEHFGWFVSPQPYTDDLNKQLVSLRQSKRVIQLPSDCK